MKALGLVAGPRRQARRRAGPRQRRLSRGEVLPRGRRAAGRDRRARGRDHESAGPERGGGRSSTARTTRSILNFPGATASPAPAAALELDCDVLVPAALEKRVHRRERAAREGQDHPRGRQRPDDAGRRSDLPAEGHAGHPRHLRQRRRRDGVVLRVAEEPLARAVRPHLEAARGSQRASHAAGDRDGDREDIHRAERADLAKGPTSRISSTPGSRKR